MDTYSWVMCGRYTYLFRWKQLQQLLRLLNLPPDELVLRFNVAPQQVAPVVRLDGKGERSGVMLEWGFVPRWAKDLSGPHPINAVGQTIFDKPMFRAAARERRCLVPVSGFYEWQEIEGQKAKQPHWIGRADREPIFFAGLWNRGERRASRINLLWRPSPLSPLRPTPSWPASITACLSSSRRATLMPGSTRPRRRRQPKG